MTDQVPSLEAVERALKMLDEQDVVLTDTSCWYCPHCDRVTAVMLMPCCDKARELLL